MPVLNFFALNTGPKEFADVWSCLGLKMNFLSLKMKEAYLLMIKHAAFFFVKILF